MEFSTLTELLDRRAAESGHLGLVEGEGNVRRIGFARLRDSALATLAGLRARSLEAGEFVILFVDDNERFLSTFWAALYGGMIPVPLAAGAASGALAKLARVWNVLDGPAVITTPELEARIGDFADGEGHRGLAGACLSGRLHAEAAAEPVEPASTDTAFIQFSSGSTGDPKGVVLTHANILANIRSASIASRYREDEVALSWMPLTHDMGLIGFHLTMLGNGFDHYIMPTALFARRPLLWLTTAAATGASLLCSPNFGYRHTLRAIENRGLPEVDLSKVRLIYNGAEPIAPGLAREFLRRLAPAGLKPESMFCVYGLAEASLAVSFPEPDTGMSTLWVERDALGAGAEVRTCEPDRPDGLELVRLGRPIPDTEVRIADDNGQALAEGRVGRVLIRGPNVTAGYYNNPAANARARVGDGYIDTGDLGFFHAGELVITGRADEVIFVHGQNHYPQDIEAVLAAAVEALDLNKVACAPVRLRGAETDSLGVFVLHRGEPEAAAPLAREIAGVINRELGIAATVIPVPRIPKTTSGKLQRRPLAEACRAGEFDAAIAALEACRQETGEPEAAGETAVAIGEICRQVVRDRTIGYDDNLFEMELSSLDLAQIFEAIEERFAADIEVTDLFDYPTINRLADYLDRQAATRTA